MENPAAILMRLQETPGGAGEDVNETERALLESDSLTTAPEFLIKRSPGVGA